MEGAARVAARDAWGRRPKQQQQQQQQKKEIRSDDVGCTYTAEQPIPTTRRSHESPLPRKSMKRNRESSINAVSLPSTTSTAAAAADVAASAARKKGRLHQTPDQRRKDRAAAAAGSRTREKAAAAAARGGSRTREAAVAAAGTRTKEDAAAAAAGSRRSRIGEDAAAVTGSRRREDATAGGGKGRSHRDVEAGQARIKGRTAAAGGAAEDAKKESQSSSYLTTLNSLQQREQRGARVEEIEDKRRGRKAHIQQKMLQQQQQHPYRETETARAAAYEKQNTAGSDEASPRHTSNRSELLDSTSSSLSSLSAAASASSAAAAACSQRSYLCHTVSPLMPPGAPSRSRGALASERSLHMQKKKKKENMSSDCVGLAGTSSASQTHREVLATATAAATALSASRKVAAAVTAPERAAAAERRRRGDSGRSSNEERKKKNKKQQLQQQRHDGFISDTSLSVSYSSRPSMTHHTAAAAAEDASAAAASAAAAAGAPSAAAAASAAAATTSAAASAAASSPDAASSFSEKLFSRYEYTAMAETQLLHPRLARALLHHQLRRPTLIQQLAIPTVLHGHDVFIQCFTGSGKTLCFAVPLLQQLLAQHERSGKQLKRSDGTRCILLLPTRELATQVCMQISKLAQLFPWIVVSSITGGEKKQSEKRRLREGVTVLLCTPGRLLDHLSSTSSFSVACLHLLVFDEADRLLDLGFEKQVRRLFLQLKERQHEQQQQQQQRHELLQELKQQPQQQQQRQDVLQEQQLLSSRYDFVSSGNKEQKSIGCLSSIQTNSHTATAAATAATATAAATRIDREEESEGGIEKEERERQRGRGNREDLRITGAEEGFQVIMVSATLTPQVQALAAFCLRQQPQWVSLTRYKHHLERSAAAAASPDAAAASPAAVAASPAAASTTCRSIKETHKQRDRQQQQQQEVRQQQQQRCLNSGGDMDMMMKNRCDEGVNGVDLFPCCCMLSPAEKKSRKKITAGGEEDNKEERRDGEMYREEAGEWFDDDDDDEKFFDVPEQLQQLYVIVEPRTRFLPLLSFLLELEKSKGKALIFVSCCDSVNHLHTLCSELRWPPPVAPHRRRDQQQLLLLQQQQRALQQQHGKGLQRVLDHIENKKRQQARRLKQQKRTAAAAANGFKDEEEEEDEEDNDEDTDDDDDGGALWGERVFKHLEFFKLHGQMNKDDRIGYLKDFMEAKSAAVAFATDVAARGLNLPHVNWIVQYDLPQQLEEYVHRIGRTARLGQQGNALLFLLSCEQGLATHLQQRGLRLQHRLEEEKMIETLCSSHVPSYLRHIDAVPRFLLKQFSTFVSTRPLLLHAARAAFLSTLRSLRALSKTSKSLCEHASLHTGHFATSFCLNERPSAAAQHLRNSGSSPACHSRTSSTVYASSEEKRDARHPRSQPAQRRVAGQQQRRGNVFFSKDDASFNKGLSDGRRNSNFSRQEREIGAHHHLVQGGRRMQSSSRYPAGRSERMFSSGGVKTATKKRKQQSLSPTEGKNRDKNDNRKQDSTTNDIVQAAAKTLRMKGDLLVSSGTKARTKQ